MSITFASKRIFSEHLPPPWVVGPESAVAFGSFHAVLTNWYIYIDVDSETSEISLQICN